ncbi:F0F1 ATP synthase subunit epsilon [Hirschia maritima]|uniref:F0F1 ATP synthase subunit epsilon n=1 Tax=Hirschia maritima TaxID=1121961 RepID=UPI000380CE2D|nr:F0F1 ATP synthase subunit epsilon [Hirschia maritima]
MSDKLHFSLVSPERELFAGEVDQVDAPGSEGQFGVLPGHAPFMATLKPGVVEVFEGEDRKRLFVRSGFADVTPQGLTILAEEAIDLEGFDASSSKDALEEAKEELRAANDDQAKARLTETISYLEALVAAAA